MMDSGSKLWSILLIFGLTSFGLSFRYEVSSINRVDMKLRCPKVKAMRNFDLSAMMGYWYVVQYYASSEELPEYACMRGVFGMEDQYVTMNFTYIYAEDPYREQLQGNITWIIPNFDVPAHWVHKEFIYQDIYNTYIIDIEYSSWALVMHCAEKSKTPRYLSALLLSREPTLGINVINFLREKLPRYDIDLSFMFNINQTICEDESSEITGSTLDLLADTETHQTRSTRAPRRGRKARRRTVKLVNN